MSMLLSALPVHAANEAVGVGAAFLVDGFVYALVANVAAVQFVRNCCRYRPWTVQKMIHLLLFAATAIRAVFLALVGYDWCDALSGEVRASQCDTAERDVFYIVDQLPVLALFATYALLVQFWAEVYYNAVDDLATLTTVIKPMLRLFMTVVLLVQLLFWGLFASTWRTEHAFFLKSQAILNMNMFLAVTTGFLYYSRRAYTELQAVPVELGIRSKKLKELARMSTICSSCFFMRCLLQLVLSTQLQQLHDRSTWCIVVIYYGLLELVPTLTILYFNRRLPLQRRVNSRVYKHYHGTSSLFFATHTHDAMEEGDEDNDALDTSLLGR